MDRGTSQNARIYSYLSGETPRQFGPSNWLNRWTELMMATNPELPNNAQSDYAHARPTPVVNPPKPEPARGGKFPWPIVAAVAAAAMLLVILAMLPRTLHLAQPPSGAQVPRQPTVDQLQFTNLRIVPAAGDGFYLKGVLHNMGNTDITGVQVEAQFLARNGPVLATIARPVEGFAGGSTQDLAMAPIKPNEGRVVRISFEHAPRGWNHQLPELTVTSVTGTTY
jgi:hypothetical protein